MVPNATTPARFADYLAERWAEGHKSARHLLPALSVFLKRAQRHSWRIGSIRGCMRSRLARPYMARFSVFKRLI